MTSGDEQRVTVLLQPRDALRGRAVAEQQRSLAVTLAQLADRAGDLGNSLRCERAPQEPDRAAGLNALVLLVVADGDNREPALPLHSQQMQQALRADLADLIEHDEIVPARARHT